VGCGIGRADVAVELARENAIARIATAETRDDLLENNIRYSSNKLDMRTRQAQGFRALRLTRDCAKWNIEFVSQ